MGLADGTLGSRGLKGSMLHEVSVSSSVGEKEDGYRRESCLFSPLINEAGVVVARHSAQLVQYTPPEREDLGVGIMLLFADYKHAKVLS